MLKTKEKRIHDVFEILRQFETLSQPDGFVTEQTYLNYLDRLYVWYLGYGNEDIYNALKGLYTLGVKASHETVKRTVFHIISILDKEV